MQIDLIAVGNRQPKWINTAVQEYQKRLPSNIKFNLIEVSPAVRSKSNSVENFKLTEQQNIEKALASNSKVIVLDERGNSISSKIFADEIRQWIDDQLHISIIIGGPDGLSDAFKQKAWKAWSLSAMTLPHGLVRIMILEQLYRGWSILQNHPYHRE